VGFVADERRVLKSDLDHGCASKYEMCEANGTESSPRTCVAGACASIDVDVNDLPEVKRGHELDNVKPLPPWQCAGNCGDAGSDTGPLTGSGGDGSGGGGSGGHTSPSTGGKGGSTGPMDAAVTMDGM